MVERDGSIQGETRFQGVRWAQVEVKTRILNGIDDWERVVPKTLDILAYCGARVTASCGHHVHLSYDEVKSDPTRVRSLWNLFHRFDSVLFGLHGTEPPREHVLPLDAQRHKAAARRELGSRELKRRLGEF